MAEKYTITTDFKLGRPVYYIYNNTVCESIVEEIIIYSYMDSNTDEIINDIKYKVTTFGESVWFDQNDLFNSLENLRIFLSSSNGERWNYEGHVIKTEYLCGTKVYFMYNNKIHENKTNKLQITISSLKTSKDVVYDIIYMFNINGEDVNISSENVYGSKSELIDSLFSSIG